MNLHFWAALVAFSLMPVGSVQAEDVVSPQLAVPTPLSTGKAAGDRLIRSASVEIDLRSLSPAPPPVRERPEWEDPSVIWQELPGAPPPGPASPAVAAFNAPAPAPTKNFAGLDFANWGAGHPPDTNGDVGPVYYIQTINASIGVYRKSDGSRIAAFSFNTFMSQGSFGNLCDTNNFGDPVVVYDSFEDRWIITDFAFTLDASSNVVNPPGAFQCFAVSKSGDPVTGGWNFYSIQLTDGLHDYPKFGVWPDGLYMSANMFDFASTGSFRGPRVWALNKAQMYAGAPSVQIVSFNAPTGDFTLLPSNARLQTGAPPAGTPNYFVSTWQYTNAIALYKFHVDWDRISLSTFSGPFSSLASTSWPNASVANAPSLGGNALDVLQIRAMVQNQYSNIGGSESIWTTHTVRRGDTTGFAAPRWYQADVTGGNVNANLSQASTWDPDGANVLHRFMPSLAVNRLGDLALGYSTSSSTAKPAIKYAGRLAGDVINTFSQTEQTLIQGTGTQTGNCGSTACARWGDYSAMTLDPDGCTFWYTNMYYAVDGLDHQTRIGSFAYPACVPVGAGGTLSGTVTAAAGGTPISGARVTIGSRSTTTNGSGFYSFGSIPAGTYTSVAIAASGFTSGSANPVVVTDGATVIKNLALSSAAQNACLVDTTQSDFQTGVFGGVELLTSAGDVLLEKLPDTSQQNATLSTSGVGITVTTFGGQTFTPSISGALSKAEVNLFCSACTGTTPSLTLSIRATSGGLPTGADLATATIAGFNSGSSVNYLATFASPLVVTAGTQYAFLIRPSANPSAGTYALTRSATDVYAGGTRVSGTTGGTVWSIPITSTVSTDAGFKIYIDFGFPANGNLASGLKDSNPAAGSIVNWGTFSWTTTAPANTSVRFQIAASNVATGPFNFVGPDGTASTFFTASVASLSQFRGFRYLKYKSYLATTDASVTPALNDVTTCFANLTVPDLSLTVSDGGATVAPGGTVAYTLSYTNSGQTAAAGVVLTETVPANATFNNAASSAGWVCAPNNAAGSTCTRSIGTLAASASGSSVFAVTAINPLPAGVSQLVNTATIADNGANGPDPTPANNTASDSTPISYADLSITVTDGVTTATPGGTVNYTITASNAGPTAVTGATVADTFPAALSCTWTCAATGGSCPPSGSGNINGPVNLAVGGSVVYTAACAVVASATGTLSNTATVTAPSGVPDPIAGNNSATDVDTLVATADLSTAVVDTPDGVVAGANISYAITMSNAGPSYAASATMQDTLPGGTTFVSLVTPSGWSCTSPAVGNNGAVSCSRAVFAPGSSVFTLVVQVAPGTATATVITNTATAASTTNDPSAGNNSSTATTTVGPQSALTVLLAGSGGGTVMASGGSINCPGVCNATFGYNTAVTLTAAPASGSTFTGWLGSGCTGISSCVVTMSAARSVTAHFAITTGGPFTLNIDLTSPNTIYDPGTDGLMALRYLFGLRGSAITNGAAGMNPGRPVAQIPVFLDDLRPLLDIDGNGQVDALTDGLLIVRHLLGLSNTALTSGALGAAATRADPAIVRSYLLGLTPP